MNLIKDQVDEQKIAIEDFLSLLKVKVSDKDLKNLEEYLTSKIEEGKVYSIRKFAEKLETQKNIKFLDAQIKHIMDVYIKKMEKGDNWLLAKKPLRGFSCASCESYMGELNDKNMDNVYWNK